MLLYSIAPRRCCCTYAFCVPHFSIQLSSASLLSPPSIPNNLATSCNAAALSYLSFSSRLVLVAIALSVGLTALHPLTPPSSNPPREPLRILFLLLWN